MMVGWGWGWGLGGEGRGGRRTGANVVEGEGAVGGQRGEYVVVDGIEFDRVDAVAAPLEGGGGRAAGLVPQENDRTRGGEDGLVGLVTDPREGVLAQERGEGLPPHTTPPTTHQSTSQPATRRGRRRRSIESASG